jgi:hypothetical protein
MPRPVWDQTPRPVWRIPAVLGLVSIAGLIAALLGDGLWDAFSWLALSAPLVVTIYCSCFGSARRSTRA